MSFCATRRTHPRTCEKLFSDISRSPSLPARQQIITDICLQLGGLKKQMGASALEGLFQQLIDNPSQLTLSTLRTAAGALVLLDSLVLRACERTWHNPTVHILAVDDDLSCQAILMSLKQTFAPPDVAEDGEAALILAAQVIRDCVPGCGDGRNGRALRFALELMNWRPTATRRWFRYQPHRF